MPSIKEKLEKSKYLVQYLQNSRYFVVICLFLVIVVIFGSFKLATLLEDQNQLGIKVVAASSGTESGTLGVKSGTYVGSKNAKTYYFPWCGTVNRIKDVNLVWFQNKTDAEAKGYKPSSVCHGLK